MKDVIKFRISLLRERFSIHGWFNIAIFSSFILAALIGFKYFISTIERYGDCSVLIGSFFYCFISSWIFPKKIDSKCLTLKSFFNKIDIYHYKKYLIYSKYCYFQFMLTYALFPTKIEKTGLFAIIFMIVQLLILSLILIRFYKDEPAYETYRWISSLIICGLIVLFNKKGFSFDSIVISNTSSVICILISILIIIFSVKKLDNENRMKTKRKVPFCTQAIMNNIGNIDLLYILRTNFLLESILVVVISGMISYVNRESFADMLLTNLFSYSYLYSSLYFQLLKNENKCHTLLYQNMGIKICKRNKIKSALIIGLSILLILSLVLISFVPIMPVAMALVLSTAMFVVNAMFFRINLEKKRGYRYVVTEREHTVFLMITSIQIVLVYFIF